MVTIYGAEWCKFCTMAKELCESMNIRYEYKDITDEKYYTEYANKFGDQNKIPQIFWFEKHIGGFADLRTLIENTNIGNYGQGEF